MFRYLRLCLPLILSLIVLAETRAQGRHGLIDPSELNRFGLERMWFTQIEVDSARGRVLQLKQHVSSTESIEVYEVVHAGGKNSYRETDLDNFGRVIGKDRAQKLANVKLIDLQSQNIQAEVVIRHVPRITIHAASDTGRVHALDGETGRTRWKAAIGNPRYPTEGVGANDEFVAAVNGFTIYVMKAVSGDPVWQRKANGAPGAGPVVTDNMVFVPMINGFIEAYRLDDPHFPPVNYRSLGYAMVQPIFTGTHVVWPTDRGHLYVTSGGENEINYRLETRSEIIARPSFLPPDLIVVSSLDGFVYCMHEKTGVLNWRFSAGEPFETSPVPFGDTVYAVTTDGNLFAIDASLGLERWNVPGMSLVIGASEFRLYCMSNTNRLTILDRESGSRLGSLSTELNDLTFINQVTDRLLIGTSRGLVQCLRERHQEFPLLHVGLRKPDAAPKPTPRGTRKPEAGQQSTDPFGGTPTDPFGGSGGTPTDPFGGSGGTPADPFGTGGGAKPAPPPVDDPFGE